MRTLTRTKYVLAALAVTSAWLCPAAVDGQVLSGYSEFQGMPVDSLRTLQVKLTYGGASKGKFTPTVLFTSVFSSADVTPFVPFYRENFGYSSDESIEPAFKAQLSELKALIDSVGTLPGVTDGGVDPDGILSFSLQNYFGGTSKVFESILGPTNGLAFFAKVLSAFTANDSARTGLVGYACGLGMMPGTPPQDVSSSVSVAVKGVRRDRKTGEFAGALRFTNTSGVSIAAPIIAAVQLKGGVSLVAANGFTSCLVPPWGTPYVNVQASGSLGAGNSVQVKVRFNNPDSERIGFQSIRILAGAGSP